MPVRTAALATLFLSVLASSAHAQDVVVLVGSRSAMPDCDQAEAFYGPVEVGGLVVLDRHRPWRGDANWSASMEPYLGTVATVVSLSGLDDVGCPGVRVDVDGGAHFWRIRDMDLARRTTEPVVREEPLTTTGYADLAPAPVYPTPYVDRPLVLAEGMLAPRLGLYLVRTPALPRGDQFLFVGGLSLAYGLTDFLEVGVDFASFELTEPAYLDPSVTSTVRLLSDELEMAFQLDAVLPVTDGSSFLLRAALPMLAHLGGVGRLDVTPSFAWRFAMTVETFFSVPVELTFNAGPYVFLGVTTSFSFSPDFFEETARIPLGLWAGGTIPGQRGPIADIAVHYSLPVQYRAITGSVDEISLWSISLDARFYSYLL